MIHLLQCFVLDLTSIQWICMMSGMVQHCNKRSKLNETFSTILWAKLQWNTISYNVIWNHNNIYTKMTNNRWYIYYNVFCQTSTYNNESACCLALYVSGTHLGGQAWYFSHNFGPRPIQPTKLCAGSGSGLDGSIKLSSIPPTQVWGSLQPP